MSYTLYMHEHKTNHKRYIGITCQKVSKRWCSGHNYKKGTHFRNAIDKYGFDMFEHKILFENLTMEEACALEIEYIKKYNTTDRRYGYNNSIGGEIGTLGSKFSEKTREKMSKARREKPNPKALEKLKEYNENKKKKVLCVETNTIYGSLREASKETGINQGCLSCCCRGLKRNSYAGTLPDGTKLHWKYINS